MHRRMKILRKMRYLRFRVAERTEDSLRVNLITVDDRVLLLVASIADVEVKVSDVIASSRVDSSEALLELLVASAMETSEEVVVLQAVLLFARSDVIAVIVLSTTLISLRVASQVIVVVSGVSWSAPVTCHGSFEEFSETSQTTSLTISCQGNSN